MSVTGAPAVLIVDDDAEVLASLAAGLARAIPGASIHAFTDPRAALRFLELEPVAVILSDERMPGMSGLALLTAAREVAPGAARMMLTAFATQDLLIRDVNEARITHFFTKPCRLPEVIAAVRRVLDEQRATAATSLRAGETPPKPPLSPRNVGTPFRGAL